MRSFPANGFGLVTPHPSEPTNSRWKAKSYIFSRVAPASAVSGGVCLTAFVTAGIFGEAGALGYILKSVERRKSQAIGLLVFLKVKPVLNNLRVTSGDASVAKLLY